MVSNADPSEALVQGSWLPGASGWNLVPLTTPACFGYVQQSTFAALHFTWRCILLDVVVIQYIHASMPHFIVALHVLKTCLLSRKRKCKHTNVYNNITIPTKSCTLLEIECQSVQFGLIQHDT
jgi:hypothetical protein